MKGSLSRAEKLLAALVICGVMAVFLPVYTSVWQSKKGAPDNTAELFGRFWAELLQDDLPVEPTTIYWFSTDNGAYSGEGKLTMKWDDFSKSRSLVPVNGEPKTFFLKTSAGDYAKIHKLSGDTVRVIVGRDLPEDVMSMSFRWRKGSTQPSPGILRPDLRKQTVKQ